MDRFFSKFLAFIMTTPLVFNVFSSSTYAGKSLKIKSSSRNSVLRGDFELNNDIDLFSVKKYEKRIILPNNEILSRTFLTKNVGDKVYIIETVKDISLDDVVEENIYNAFDFREFSSCFSRGKLKNVGDLISLSERAYETFRLQYIERQPFRFFVNNFLEYRNREQLKIFCENLTGFLNNGVFCEESIENKSMKSFFEIMIIINCALDDNFGSGILNFDHYNVLKSLVFSGSLSGKNIFEKISISLKSIKEYMDISNDLHSNFIDDLIRTILDYI